MLAVLVSVLVSVFSSGCISAYVADQSRTKIAMREAIIRNDQSAIKAIRLGDNGVGLGIDLLSWRTLSEQPLKQLGAAVGDALIIWGGYEGVKSISESVGGDKNDTTSGRDSNNVTVNGNGNDVHVGDETTTTTGQ